MPMIYRVGFRPLHSFERPVTPRDLHRLACYLLEHPGRDAHADQPKQFSIWPLEINGGDLDDDEFVGSRPEQVTVRLCQLDDDPQRDAQLRKRLMERPNLGREHPLEMIDLDVEHHAMIDLVSVKPEQQLSVEFLSPTHFSRNGRRYCLPDPVLVWNRITDRWNATVGEASPFVIDERDRSSIAAQVSLTACDIETVGKPYRPDGFVGIATFALDRFADQEIGRIFAAVWRLAELSGVGALTTQGYGAIRIISQSEGV